MHLYDRFIFSKHNRSCMVLVREIVLEKWGFSTTRKSKSFKFLFFHCSIISEIGMQVNSYDRVIFSKHNSNWMVLVLMGWVVLEIFKYMSSWKAWSVYKIKSIALLNLIFCQRRLCVMFSNNAVFQAIAHPVVYKYVFISSHWLLEDFTCPEYILPMHTLFGLICQCVVGKKTSMNFTTSFQLFWDISVCVNVGLQK